MYVFESVLVISKKENHNSGCTEMTLLNFGARVHGTTTSRAVKCPEVLQSLNDLLRCGDIRDTVTPGIIATTCLPHLNDYKFIIASFQLFNTVSVSIFYLRSCGQ